MRAVNEMRCVVKHKFKLHFDFYLKILRFESEIHQNVCVHSDP
jgi:hypothetical protein